MTRPRLVCSSIGLIVAIAIAGTGVFAQQTPPRDARAAGPTGTSELAGTIVVDEPGAAPIPYAQIAVLGLDSGLIRITSSDGTGRFRLTGLPAGRYLVSGSKPPYVAAVYGARQTGRPGTAVAVVPQRISATCPAKR